MTESLVALTRHGLGPIAGQQMIAETDDWAQLLRTAEAHRVLGLVAAGVADGAADPGPDERDALVERLAYWLSADLDLERLLLRVVDVFDRRGIEYRVVKGPALAHQIYPDPSWRLFADIDLVVRSGDFGPARRAIVDDLGGVEPWPELRPGFDARFGKEALIPVGAYELDLHRTLVAGPFGLRMPIDALFGDAGRITLGGRTLATPGPTATALQVCFNAALGDVPPRLSALRDVAQVCAVLDPRLDEVRAEAERWQATAVVARAITLTWSTLGLDPDHPWARWAAAHRAGRLDRFLIEASTSTSRSYTRQLANVAVIGGVGPRLSYLRAIVSPQPSYLAARGWTRGTHVQRALARLRAARPGSGVP